MNRDDYELLLWLMAERMWEDGVPIRPHEALFGFTEGMR